MALQSTVASIQNIRKQRQLEMELGELDKKWHVELKVIARERLALVKELCRINQEMMHIDHFQDSVRGKALSRFADKAQSRLLLEKEQKESHKFSFQPDPVDKMNLQLPLIREEGPGEDGARGDVGKAVTSKELYKQRVQLQKTTSEQCAADRRNRRRPFWDKAIIRSKKPDPFQNRNIFIKATRPAGPVFGPSVPVSSQSAGENEDEPMKRPVLSKSPSLPALNRLARSDLFRPNVLHPSLSKRHSASMGYLPVISSAARGQLGAFKPFGAVSLTSRGLPTIVES